MILKRFRLNPWSGKIDDLYGAIVAQSRRQVFYTGYGVPDTIEGRFDVIVLHIVVMLASLDRAGPALLGSAQVLMARSTGAKAPALGGAHATGRLQRA